MKKIETVEEYNETKEELFDSLGSRAEVLDQAMRRSSGEFYFDSEGNAIALRSDLIRKPTGEAEIIEMLSKTEIIAGVERMYGGSWHFWLMPDCGEQIEAALEGIMSK